MDKLCTASVHFVNIGSIKDANCINSSTCIFNLLRKRGRRICDGRIKIVVSGNAIREQNHDFLAICVISGIAVTCINQLIARTSGHISVP